MAAIESVMTGHSHKVAQLYEFDDFDRERLFRLSNRIGDICNLIEDISKSAYLEISPIELGISAIELEISAIELEICALQLGIYAIQ